MPVTTGVSFRRNSILSTSYHSPALASADRLSNLYALDLSDDNDVAEDCQQRCRADEDQRVIE